ncbi:hypothetical protein BG000_005118 [Podila horticola]|nr:hypothetical protein BG000_005118 [Podila horticola]
MGAWSLLAITHVLIVCGLVTLPESLMDEVLVVGERILEDSADPMKIVIPSLYGIQCFAWCGSLACIAVTRAAASDPTLGFEIQSPTMTHRLKMAQQQRVGRQQSIFGFRKSSTISPIGKYEHGNKLSQKDFATQNSFRDGAEELDGQRIIIPNDRRISQVVVTFRSDLDSIQMEATRMNTDIHAPEAAVVAPQRSSAIYITNHNYNLKDSTYTSIPFSLPGESLSDMIFSAVQTEMPITRGPPPKAQEMIPQPEQGPPVQSRSQEQEPRPSESSNRTVSTVASTTATKKSATDLATLSSTTTLDEGLDAHGSFDLEREPHPQVSSILSKDQVQQLEKIQQQRQYQQQHHQSTWQLLMEQDRKQNMEKQQVVQHVTFPIVPTRRSSFNHQNYEKEMDFSSPAIQSNSSDPSEPYISTTDRHISIATTTSVILPKEQPPSSPVVSPVSARSKSSVLKYWKMNRSSDSSISSEESSITQGYFTNAFSNKKSKTKPAMIVPSIVLHPDEDDGEPPRVLSQKDIEYLSTAPPVPLRPLIQPWDEPEESHDGYGDGYDYDYDYDSYHQEEEGEEEEESEESEVSEESEEGDEGHRHHQLVEGEYDDPYALDVPINLEIDLQGLEHGEVKGYGYI